MSLDNNSFKSLLEKAFNHQTNEEYSEAERIYKYLLSVDKKNPDVLRLLGTLYVENGENEKAIRFLEASNKENPTNYYTHLNLGAAYGVLEDEEKFLHHLNLCIKIDPNKFEGYFTLAYFFSEKKSFFKALNLYEKAYLINKEIPRIEQYIFRCKKYLADWKNYKYYEDIILNSIKNKKLNYWPLDNLLICENPSYEKSNIELFLKSYLKKVKKTQPKKNNFFSHKKINIAYFSGDFKDHPVAHLISGVFEHHDKNNFDIYGFSTIDLKNQKNSYTERISSAIKIIDISKKSLAQIEKLCLDLEIDIAIDLSGMTEFNRIEIFYNRVAPIQINYLGYPGTLGPKLFDYIIADSKIIPKEEQNNYHEKIIYLPNSYQPNDDKQKISDLKFTKAELGLPENNFIFACFNHPGKITPSIFDLWANILNKVNDSVLWLLEFDEISKKNILGEANKRNIKTNKIIFSKRIKFDENLSRTQNADLFLDTYPYNAHTTARDFLWSGVPVLTLCGKTFASRVGYSLLSALNLSDELTCFDKREYEEKAIMLSTNKLYYEQLRNKLAINKVSEPLFNTSLYTKNIEDAFKRIYERDKLNLPAENIYIN
jgi:predicted O-linked N-acetylglucosamine transferase (SPINDLY family)